ncbi:unnamed protein product [Paramecium octaurelia]|uniref:Transmembrane protein n=1 Tax=Paramecium octaurelia TaxID=43137 RepID=A0A8S1VNF7_PAROT|nr:unnamed protein product [Paramecium octaurelia]
MHLHQQLNQSFRGKAFSIVLVNNIYLIYIYVLKYHLQNNNLNYSKIVLSKPYKIQSSLKDFCFSLTYKSVQLLLNLGSYFQQLNYKVLKNIYIDQSQASSGAFIYISHSIKETSQNQCQIYKKPTVINLKTQRFCSRKFNELMANCFEFRNRKKKIQILSFSILTSKNRSFQNFRKIKDQINNQHYKRF